jgi:hypothetical protein
MTANSRVFPLGLGFGEKVSHDQFTALDLNGAQSINRNSSVSGYRRFPLRPITTATPGGSIIATGHASPANTLICNNIAYTLILPLDELPHGQTLQSVGVVILPASGHSSSAPAVLPELGVYKQGNAITGTLIKAASYTWTTYTDYEMGFVLMATTMGEVIDRANVYFAAITLESGANSQSGLALYTLFGWTDIDHSLGGADLSLWI